MSKQGTLSVHTENIFPIIKKFLYSDQEIFLRELVSNAVDATQKLKMLASRGEYNEELGDLTIQVSVDKDKKTLTISDKGIGMTAGEVEKYINQIAFSSAEEFVQKYVDKDAGNIIGHFGLGFYSAFMVAHKVEINTLSYQENAEAVHWSCVGTTSYEMEEGSKKERGTEIVLHIAEDSEEYLEKARIEAILNKYCRFMPIPVEFDGKTINETSPLWLKKPSDIKDEEYKEFYDKLFPYSGEPLFWIHLNVDYPFNLTGILYFPKVENIMDTRKDKIHLYSNQVFVTSEVKEIVPEFLTLLHGVIDSPDIPLNVSRSYLQSDQNVKKISSYIVKKVGDKLHEIFKDNREDFEKKWDDISFFIKYGMLTDDKFSEKAKDFSLVKNMAGSYFTFEEYKEKVKPLQTDKDNRVIWLYTTDPQQQHGYIEAAKKRSYDILKFDNPIDAHFMQQLETKLEDVSLKRVDADTLDKLVDKDEKSESVLSENEQKKLEEVFKANVDKEKFNIKLEPLSPEDAPVVITQSEFMRRMKDMSRLSGMPEMGDMPGSYEVVINTNHPLNKQVITARSDEKQARLTKHLFDLARLSQNMLKGEELASFVERSVSLLDSKK